MSVINDEAQEERAVVRVAIGASALSLLLSGWMFIQGLDDAELERAVDARLACLEITGPNDCGTDGK